MTTIILRVFNVEEISIWYMFGSATAFSHYFEFGIGPTIIRFIAYENADGNKTKLYETIAASINIYFFLSLLVLLFSGLFVVYVQKFYDHELSIIIWIYPFLNAVNFFLKFNDSALKGCGHIIKYNHWNAIFFLINSVILSSVIFFNKNIEFNLILLHTLLALNGIKNLFLLKSNVDLSKVKENISLGKISQRLNRYVKPTIETALMSMSSTGVGHGINIFLPALIGVNFASSFFVLQKIFRVIDEFSYGPFYAYIPKFMESWASHNSLKDHQGIIYRTIVFSLMLILGVGCLLFPILNNVIPLLDLNIVLLSPTLILLMTVVFLLERSSGFVSQLFLVRDITSQFKYFLLTAAIIITALFVLNDVSLYKFLMVLVVSRFIELALIYRKYILMKWE